MVNFNRNGSGESSFIVGLLLWNMVICLFPGQLAIGKHRESPGNISQWRWIKCVNCLTMNSWLHMEMSCTHSHHTVPSCPSYLCYEPTYHRYHHSPSIMSRLIMNCTLDDSAAHPTHKGSYGTVHPASPPSPIIHQLSLELVGSPVGGWRERSHT